MLELHPQLQKDCLVIGRFPLCLLLIMRDANYPWFILVPDRLNLSEIYQLSEIDQQQFIRESSLLAKALHNQFQADKINIGALGNVVPQLHIHHVARYKNDAAWPAPIWGAAPAKAYTANTLAQAIARLKSKPIDLLEYFA